MPTISSVTAHYVPIIKIVNNVIVAGGNNSYGNDLGVDPVAKRDPPFTKLMNKREAPFA